MLYLDFTSVSPKIYFPLFQFPIQDPVFRLDVIPPQSSPVCDSSSLLSFSFTTLTIQWSSKFSFVECPLISVYLVFSPDSIKAMHSKEEKLRGNVLFSVSDMKSTYLIIGDINLDHMIKVMSARCLHRKVTIFPFVINKLHSLRLQISCFFLNFEPFMLTFIGGYCLQQDFLVMIFYFLYSF